MFNFLSVPQMTTSLTLLKNSLMTVIMTVTVSVIVASRLAHKLQQQSFFSFSLKNKKNICCLYGARRAISSIVNFFSFHCTLSANSHESTAVTAPYQHWVQSFQGSQRCFKGEDASAASGEGLLLYLNTCLKWLCWVIEGQSERGHLEPCVWWEGTVMGKTGKDNLTPSDGQ